MATFLRSDGVDRKFGCEKFAPNCEILINTTYWCGCEAVTAPYVVFIPNRDLFWVAPKVQIMHFLRFQSLIRMGAAGSPRAVCSAYYQPPKYYHCWGFVLAIGREC